MLYSCCSQSMNDCIKYHVRKLLAPCDAYILPIQPLRDVSLAPCEMLLFLIRLRHQDEIYMKLGFILPSTRLKIRICVSFLSIYILVITKIENDYIYICYYDNFRNIFYVLLLSSNFDICGSKQKGPYELQILSYQGEFTNKALGVLKSRGCY